DSTSGSTSASMHASEMVMAFFSSTTTALYSDGWTPSSAGAYAGTCIFLIVLAVVFRALLAAKHRLEALWHDQALQRRYVVAAERDAGGFFGKDADVRSGVLSINGVEEEVRVVRAPTGPVQAFRLTTDVPRAALVVVIVGVGYLLMLAVMTLNVGYFLSILGGTFLGELVFGRFGHA
ncbi:low affinity copper transporter, partial [Eremomyces bilateralis CBS 781.70]